MSFVVVDGRTDKAKLIELLGIGCEQTELDYKEDYDLSSKEGKLEFAKDAVSMANHYPGGYLVIGATDEGQPSERFSENHRRVLDSAILTDIVAKYADGNITINAQRVAHEGHEYCLIYIGSPKDGLPIPFKCNGQYSKGDKKPKFVFHEGEILRRNNAKNGHIAHADWVEILEHHDDLVRKQERETIDELLKQVTAALAEKKKPVPLVVGMPEESISDALDDCFESGDTIQIKRYARQVASLINNGELLSAYNLAAIGCYAALHEDDEQFLQVGKQLYEAYERKVSASGYLSEVGYVFATALYVMGSAAVRNERWGCISKLVNKQTGRSDYRFASWLRACQATSYDAYARGDGKCLPILSNALYEMERHISLRPEYRHVDTESPEWDAVREELLTSLCAFDLLYCISVYTEGEGEAGAYPLCLSYPASRLDDIVRELVSIDGSMRHELFPGTDDEGIRAGISRLLDDMKEELFDNMAFWSKPNEFVSLRKYANGESVQTLGYG